MAPLDRPLGPAPDLGADGRRPGRTRCALFWIALEIGLSRTAQWCGDGRPCDIDTFTKRPLGKDNCDDAGSTLDNESSNQLARIDIRWALSAPRLPIAVYSPFIGAEMYQSASTRSCGGFRTPEGAISRTKFAFANLPMKSPTIQSSRNFLTHT